MEELRMTLTKKVFPLQEKKEMIKVLDEGIGQSTE